MSINISSSGPVDGNNIFVSLFLDYFVGLDVLCACADMVVQIAFHKMTVLCMSHCLIKLGYI